MTGIALSLSGIRVTRYCRRNQGRVECFDLYECVVATLKLAKKVQDDQGKIFILSPDADNKNIPDPNDGWNSPKFKRKGYAAIVCRPDVYGASPRDPYECPILKKYDKDVITRS